MYGLTLTTDRELNDEEFAEVFTLLDNLFQIRQVLTFDEKGNKINTIATLEETDDGYEYEYDIQDKVCAEAADKVVTQLAELLDGDFELDAPIIKEEGMSCEN